MTGTREEHMAFCKKRALQYLDKGDVSQAIASMLSDLSSHEDTKGVGELMSGIGLMTAMNNNQDEAFKFIDGFA